MLLKFRKGPGFHHKKEQPEWLCRLSLCLTAIAPAECPKEAQALRTAGRKGGKGSRLVSMHVKELPMSLSHGKTCLTVF